MGIKFCLVNIFKINLYSKLSPLYCIFYCLGVRQQSWSSLASSILIKYRPSLSQDHFYVSISVYDSSNKDTCCQIWVVGDFVWSCLYLTHYATNYEKLFLNQIIFRKTGCWVLNNCILSAQFSSVQLVEYVLAPLRKVACI